MGQPVTRQPFRVARSRIVRLDEEADPAHVVVAEERGQLVDVRVGVGVPVVTGEEGFEPACRLALGRERARRVLEREVQHGLHPVVGC
jgi:hypothetical protein